MLTLGLLMSLTVHAAPSGGAWVVVSRRSGVSAKKAAEVSAGVAAVLKASGLPSARSPEDLSKCNGKRPCLIELGRKQNVAAMVLLEVGTVLDDGFARAEAVSVEEDGRRLGLAEYEGPLATLSKGLEPIVTRNLVPALKGALGAASTTPELPPPPPPPAPPLVTHVEVAPQPQLPPPAPPVPAVPAAVTEVAKPVEKSSWGPRRVVGSVVALAGVGTLAAAAGTGLGALDQSNAAQRLCPTGQPCTDPAAYAAYRKASGAQTTALMLTGIGAVAVAVGATLFFLELGDDARVSLAPTPQGAAAVFSTRW